MDDLQYRLNGKIPRNFLLNIKGLIGTPTGIFKSTMGLQIAFALDPNFNLKQRVAFSVNQLLDKIKENTEYNLCGLCCFNFTKGYKGTYETIDLKKEIKCDNCDNVATNTILLTKLIFFLDEQTQTLKTGGMIRLANIVDTVRQRQICFITCGVEAYDFHFITYELRRVQESDDDYLPAKQVRYVVFDPERDLYYGYYRWDITPLTNPKWKEIWSEYSTMKSEFQRIAMSGQISQMDFDDYATEVINSEDFSQCFRMTQAGRKTFQPSIAKMMVFKFYPDFTRDEREMVLSCIKVILAQNNGL